MVIMDEVLYSQKVVGKLTTPNRPIEIYNQAKKAVELLHESNLVFGDLRPPNMLYVEKTGRLQLVDFDMAGENGVARYPATLNPNHTWPPSIKPGVLLMKEHDLEWLTRLKGWIETGVAND